MDFIEFMYHSSYRKIFQNSFSHCSLRKKDNTLAWVRPVIWSLDLYLSWLLSLWGPWSFEELPSILTNTLCSSTSDDQHPSWLKNLVQLCLKEADYLNLSQSVWHEDTFDCPNITLSGGRQRCNCIDPPRSLCVLWHPWSKDIARAAQCMGHWKHCIITMTFCLKAHYQTMAWGDYYFGPMVLMVGMLFFFPAVRHLHKVNTDGQQEIWNRVWLVCWWYSIIFPFHLNQERQCRCLTVA